MRLICEGFDVEPAHGAVVDEPERGSQWCVAEFFEDQAAAGRVLQVAIP